MLASCGITSLQGLFSDDFQNRWLVRRKLFSLRGTILNMTAERTRKMKLPGDNPKPPLKSLTRFWVSGCRLSSNWSIMHILPFTGSLFYNGISWKSGKVPALHIGRKCVCNSAHTFRKYLWCKSLFVFPLQATFPWNWVVYTDLPHYRIAACVTATLSEWRKIGETRLCVTIVNRVQGTVSGFQKTRGFVWHN